MTIVTFADATAVAVQIPAGHDVNAPAPSVRTFFGQLGAGDGPQAFLATLVAPTTVRAHFHRIDQFQVFLGEPGSWYQRHPLGPVVVHYADRYTTYGPFGTDQGSMQFLTLRAQHGDYTGFMPEARAELIERPGRNVHVDLDDVTAEDRGATGIHCVLDGSGGLEALAVRGEAGARVQLPAATTEHGEYHFLFEGSMLLAGSEYTAPAVGWFERHDAPEDLTAGVEGFRSLVMRFPGTARVDQCAT